MKKHAIFGIAMLLVVGLTACGRNKEIEENKPKEQMEQEESKKEEGEKRNEQQQEEFVEKGEELENSSDTQSPISLKINVYYPNEENGEIVSKEVEIEQLDARIIWRQLQKVGIANADSGVLGIEINENEGTMMLDLNEAFGEQLRSAGTTGEKEIIDSVINTYLEAFNCEKVLLQENGGILMSGHKEYTNYMEKR